LDLMVGVYKFHPQNFSQLSANSRFTRPHGPY
jgi:hypothetical protein